MELKTSNKPKPTLLQYETRLLAYIDILGWSSLVRGSTSDPSVLNAVLEAVDHMRQMVRGLKKLKITTTHFSDTIVVSIPTASVSGILAFHTMIHLLCFSLLATRRLYTRGAIVVGQVIHTSDRIVGPALIDAYTIESTIAKYPRIVVTEEANSILRMHHRNGATVTRRDHDGLDFLEIVPFNKDAAMQPVSTKDGQTTPLAVTTADVCGEIRDWILPIREQHKADLNLYAKHSWMISYLETVLLDLLNHLEGLQRELDEKK